jgi:hypothetical protein
MWQREWFSTRFRCHVRYPKNSESAVNRLVQGKGIAVNHAGT